MLKPQHHVSFLLSIFFFFLSIIFCHFIVQLAATAADYGARCTGKLKWPAGSGQEARLV